MAYKTVVLGHAVQTTSNCLSAVRRAHLAMGFELPTPASYFPLREAIRGARRYLSKPTVQKLPISPGILMQLVASTEWGSSLRCLYLSLWYTFSRLASLIPTAKNSVYECGSHLSWGNITFLENGVHIILEKTKTIQCHERRLEFLIPKHSNESICLLTQLKAWFNATPFKSKNHPVFLHLGGVYVPLSRRLATPPFKNALATAGVNPKNFGWSSF